MHSSSLFDVQRASSSSTSLDRSLTNNMGGAQSAFRAPPTNDEISIEQVDTTDRSNRFANSSNRTTDGVVAARNVFTSFSSNSPLYSSSSDANHSLGACRICGDRATGKHYGAHSCDGCKGFFRRTVRKNHHYVCRFRLNCLIDRDKRNTCRFCRFQSCIRAGMKKEAVQNERDRIRCVKRKSESIDNQQNNHLNLIMEAERIANQLRASVITNGSASSPPPAMTVSPSGLRRLASLTDVSDATKQQLILLVEWAKALPPFGELDLNDQVALLRAYSAVHLILGVARRSTPYKDVLLLSNDACIPRSHSSEIHDVNHVAAKVLDELVEPMRDLSLNDIEYGCLKALLFFNPNSQGLSDKEKVKETRQSFLEALQEYVGRQRDKVDKVRFGNILLLSPPLQALSQQFVEDLQLANLFGITRFDKLLEELLLSTSEPFSAPFFHDGISAVADRMAGGLLNLANGANNGTSASNFTENACDKD